MGWSERVCFSFIDSCLCKLSSRTLNNAVIKPAQLAFFFYSFWKQKNCQKLSVQSTLQPEVWAHSYCFLKNMTLIIDSLDMFMQGWEFTITTVYMKCMTESKEKHNWFTLKVCHETRLCLDISKKFKLIYDFRLLTYAVTKKRLEGICTCSCLCAIVRLDSYLPVSSSKCAVYF